MYVTRQYRQYRYNYITEICRRIFIIKDFGEKVMVASETMEEDASWEYCPSDEQEKAFAKSSSYWFIYAWAFCVSMHFKK